MPNPIQLNHTQLQQAHSQGTAIKFHPEMQRFGWTDKPLRIRELDPDHVSVATIDGSYIAPTAPGLGAENGFQMDSNGYCSGTPLFTWADEYTQASTKHTVANTSQYCNGSCGGEVKQVFCGIAVGGESYNYCCTCKKERA